MSFMIEHPETRAKLEVILEIEKKLDADKLINEAIEKTEMIKFEQHMDVIEEYIDSYLFYVS